jgi:predicted metalloprotease with PDZ domain
MRNPLRMVCLLLFSSVCLCVTRLTGQSVGPQPAPMPPAIPAPLDRPYVGAIRLDVDATDTDHRIVTVHETIPVAAAGPVILLYPQWIPGEHTPDGPLPAMASLVMHAGGARVAWTRDPVDVFAFHIDVPVGAKTVDADFQWLTPVNSTVGAITMTPEIVDLPWNAVVLYPAGYYSRQITIEPSIRVRDGWQVATALDPASTSGARTSFKPVTLNTLVDSPVYAGQFFKRYDLDPGGPAPVWLDVFGDKPDQLEAPPEALAAHRALVQQAYKLYGSHHYGHYDFLFSVSDRLAGNGLEHHQSSEDGTSGDYFTDWPHSLADRDLLPHEYTHSWNGKFRRPADLWTPNFNVPMRDSLLWVYEGQTQYWGYVLAARAGLWTNAQTLDALANVAAEYDHTIGRTWRQLEDTTNDPIIANRRPLSWRAWQRSEDYYSEGQLIWLDADTLIRDRTNGAKSLDDFARAFFGINDGSVVTVTYTFDDVVRALNGVLPYDWATFLRTRLESHGPGAPLDGVARGGYRLVYTDAPTWAVTANDLTYSLGAVIGNDGTLGRVLWNGPLFSAGLTFGAKVVAVNGVVFTVDGLRSAVTSAKGTTAPIELTVQAGDQVRTIRVAYHDGLRYPHLVRDETTPARLDEILAARK